MRLPLNGNPAISTPFGVPDTNSRFGKHVGIDYPTAIGTPVYAAVSGTVTVLANDQYNGNGLSIENSGKWYRVLHLSKYVVLSGQVKEGDLVAYSGNTGLSTGPHVHFDVRTKFVPTSFSDFINPLSLLKETNMSTVTDLYLGRILTASILGWDGTNGQVNALDASGAADAQINKDFVGKPVEQVIDGMYNSPDFKKAQAFRHSVGGDAAVLKPGRYQVN